MENTRINRLEAASILKPKKVELWVHEMGLSRSQVDGDRRVLMQLGVLDCFGRSFDLLVWKRDFNAYDRAALRGQERFTDFDGPTFQVDGVIKGILG